MIKVKEHDEQMALIQWVNLNKKIYPELDMLFAIPNGGQRNVIVANKLKKEGVQPGIPDLCLPVARGRYNGLFIELKVKGNYPTEKQKEWIRKLHDYGYLAMVCYGFEEARDAILRYIKLEHDENFFI